jgi:hypothetical protein
MPKHAGLAMGEASKCALAMARRPPERCRIALIVVDFTQFPSRDRPAFEWTLDWRSGRL